MKRLLLLIIMLCAMIAAQAYTLSEPEVTVSDITATSAHISWVSDLTMFEVRLGADATPVEVTGKEYELIDLSHATEYVVAIRGYRMKDKNQKVYTDWSEPIKFTTKVSSDVDNITTNNLNVTVGSGSITIYNTDVYVESVLLLDVQGRILGKYVTKTSEDITIPANITGMAVVVVKTADERFVYKVNIK